MFFIHKIGFKYKTDILVFWFFYRNRTNIAFAIAYFKLQVTICNKKSIIKNIINIMPVYFKQLFPCKNIILFGKTAGLDIGYRNTHIYDHSFLSFGTKLVFENLIFKLFLHEDCRNDKQLKIRICLVEKNRE